MRCIGVMFSCVHFIVVERHKREFAFLKQQQLSSVLDCPCGVVTSPYYVTVHNHVPESQSMYLFVGYPPIYKYA